MAAGDVPAAPLVTRAYVRCPVSTVGAATSGLQAVEALVIAVKYLTNRSFNGQILDMLRWF